MEAKTYQNNTATNRNRRRLTIVDNSNPTQIIVDVDRVDASTGDAINAALFQRLENEVVLLGEKVNTLEEVQSAQSNLESTDPTSGTNVYVGGNLTAQLNFTSNPQTQLDNISNTVSSFNNNMQDIQNINNNISTVLNSVIPELNSFRQRINDLDSVSLQNILQEINQIKNNTSISVNTISMGNWTISLSNNNLVFNYNQGD